MPHSPTSSEDEMAQSFSDYSVGSESDSSKEETIYDTIRATAEKPSTARTEESQGNTLVIRILIQDLQQTVGPVRSLLLSASVAWARGCLWSPSAWPVLVASRTSCTCPALPSSPSAVPLSASSHAAGAAVHVLSVYYVPGRGQASRAQGPASWRRCPQWAH